MERTGVSIGFLLRLYAFVENSRGIIREYGIIHIERRLRKNGAIRYFFTINAIFMTMKIYYGVFIGTIIVVLAGVMIFSRVEQGKIDELAQKFPDWIAVQGDLAPFEAFFPQEPQIEEFEQPIPDSDLVIKQKVYVAEVVLDMTYALSVAAYPSSLGGETEENLRDSLNGMVASLPDGELVSSRMIVPVSGEKSLEYLIHRKEVGPYLKGRLMLKNQNTLYQYWVSYLDESHYNDDAYTYFVNSFHSK